MVFHISIAPQKFASKDGNCVVESDKERKILGEKPPADGNDTNCPCGNSRGEEKDKTALGNTGATRCRAEVEEHIEEDHASHDGVPVCIGHTKSEQEAWNDGVDTEEV